MDTCRLDPRGLPVLRVGEIPTEPTPRRWLIEGLWGAAAVGFIGGAAQVLQVLSGHRHGLQCGHGDAVFGDLPGCRVGPGADLPGGRRTVGGRANACWRWRFIAASGWLKVNVHVITAPRLRLDQSGDRTRLLETARRIRPRLLVLDPLVRLHAVDENSATEISGLLSGLRDLQRRLDLAVVLVHHTRKSPPAGVQAGQGSARFDRSACLRRLQPLCA